MTPSSRRMRRSRDVPAANDDEPVSGFDAYKIQGDSAAALELFAKQKEKTLALEYNTLLLSRLQHSSDGDEILQQMQGSEIQFQDMEQSLSPRKRKRNDLIRSYNRALVLLANGEIRQAVQIACDKLKDSIQTLEKPPEELSNAFSNLGFLFIECFLALQVGQRTATCAEEYQNINPHQVIDWLDKFDAEKDPELKFLLNLYKSRLNLAELDGSGKHDDNKIRSARKELKQAMDVFQHKLRPSLGAETGSVVSSANSEENMSTATPHQPVSEQSPPPSSLVLQKYNQSALSIKAHSEQLKGNTKKSLVLCAEAQAAASNGSAYEALHSNNLAVVYETNGKRHLALHALAKGLRVSKKAAPFRSDGTVCLDQSLLVVHNSAICALLARNYLSAYECMATCIAGSNVFRNQARCWLRMAEACIGVFSELKSKNNKKMFLAFEIDDESKGIILDNVMFSDHPEVINEDLETVLASPNDLEQVKRSPLLRARASLQRALKNETLLDREALLSARLMFAYVSLAFRDYEQALDMSKLVMSAVVPHDNDEGVIRSTHKRRLATARLYAAEASCALGETMSAMKFLVGDGQDDAFDRLAYDLSGVTLETAATNGNGKRRLARAQTIVRSSASSVTAAMGNHTAAKQLAMSAQAMEDAYATNRERSCARRALIYTLLRSGHEGPALSLLRSLR